MSDFVLSWSRHDGVQEETFLEYLSLSQIAAINHDGSIDSKNYKFFSQIVRLFDDCCDFRIIPSVKYMVAKEFLGLSPNEFDERLQEKKARGRGQRVEETLEGGRREKAEMA